MVDLAVTGPPSLPSAGGREAAGSRAACREQDDGRSAARVVDRVSGA